MSTYSRRLNRSILREAESLSSLVRVWKFTAGHTGGRGFMDYFLRKDRIALGYIYNKGLATIETPKDLPKLRNYESKTPSYNVQRQLWDFLSMATRDIVALKLGSEVVAAGVVDSEELLYDDSPLESRYFREKQYYPNRRKVKWFRKFEPQPIKGRDLAKSFRYPQDTIHEITDRSSKVKILAWIVWYRDNLATSDERRLIDEIGKLRAARGTAPSRILTTSEIAEKELAAIKKVMNFEKNREKRDVALVYDFSVGYDLESRSACDTRYIEVKSRYGGYPVVLTDGEMKAARRHGNDYYLYVVTSEHQLLRLRNPYRLRKKPLTHIVWELQGWDQKSERISI